MPEQPIKFGIGSYPCGEGPDEELDRLRRFAAQVEGFISERGGYLTALEDHPDNSTEHWLLWGHAEARRQLFASLPWPPDDDTAERIKAAARVS